VSASTDKFELNTGWTSLWVTLASKWFCEALYLWTVVAPAVLPGRDWS
jgi:serine incorporator 1/3